MKRVLSGIQPSGHLTIGNYIGAMQNFVKLQHKCKCFFMVADLHAVSTPQNPEKLHEQTEAVVALYIAAGIDPNQANIFLQSHVHQHAEFGWLLTTLSYMGNLERMTQFKDKCENEQSVSTSLLIYPTLMAADILLYQADLIPVGSDQKQHLELTRDLAARFNKRFGKCLTIPEPLIPQLGARIMSLDDASKKMSKSNPNPGSFIALLDDPAIISKKISRAKTDSKAVVKFDPINKPEISNLMTIYSHISGISIAEIEAKYEGRMYSLFKKGLAEHIVAFIEPLQARYYEIRRTGEHYDALHRGAKQAHETAKQTLTEVKRRMGFVLLP